MFHNEHKHIPVTPKEGGSAQEVTLSPSDKTNDRENDSLAKPKIKPTSSRPPALTLEVS